MKRDVNIDRSLLEKHHAAVILGITDKEVIVVDKKVDQPADYIIYFVVGKGYNECVFVEGTYNKMFHARIVSYEDYDPAVHGRMDKTNPHCGKVLIGDYHRRTPFDEAIERGDFEQVLKETVDAYSDVEEEEVCCA